MSSDPAHSLGDALGVALSDSWSPIGDNLTARELNTARRLDDQWNEIRDYLVSVFEWAGLASLEAEELAVVPGLDELFALSDIATVADEGIADVLVVDCAPTAETLRLLAFPEVITRAMETVFPVGRRLNRLLGPLVTRLSDAPALSDGVFDATERLGRRFEGVRELLSDSETTSVRIVTTAERMVVAETTRMFTYLCLYGIPVDAVIANRVLPSEAASGWSAEWVSVQERGLAALAEAFEPPRLLRAPLSRTEIIGPDALADLAAVLYGTSDPAGVFTPTVPLRLRSDPAGGAVLELDVPFVDRSTVDVAVSRYDLVVTIGSQRRAIRLPDSLADADVVSAHLDRGCLTVTFGPPAP